MSSSSGAEETLITSPHEQQANAPVAKTMDAKLMLATGSGDVQHLKNLVNKQEDSKMMVVVMARQQAASSMHKHHPPQGNMDPHLLALASSGSSEKLQALANGKDSQASGHGGTDGSLTTRQASFYGDDTEANESILEGVTAEGDTALHVVAACGEGQHFFSRRCCWCLTCTEHHSLTTNGDGDNFLESACIIYGKAKHLLFVQNNRGNTPLHCAARAGKFKMVKCLIEIAEGENRMEELLWKENKHKETALHEAVRVGNKDIVDLLMGKDSTLASFPQEGGTSPMYLAIMLKQDEIVKTLHDKSSHGMLSFSGPNGQNALHAAVLRHRDLTRLLLEWNETHLCPQNKDLTTQRDENGSTPLQFVAAIESRVGPSSICGQLSDLKKLLKWNETHLCPQNRDLTTQRDEIGSTPLHFAAAMKFLFRPSSICQQVLEANPDALYQPDHAGFFPIHVAASVGALRNVDMFVKKCPGSAGLRDAKGRTFLHVAVEEKELGIIRSACRNLSLSWIMNMVDNDGNTALHLAVEAGSLQMFCHLLANPQVNLNLPNSRGETPLDIAEYKIPKDRLFYDQSSEAQICSTLRTVGAVKGIHCKIVRVKAHDESKERDVLKDSTQIMCIGSVLIATVTFGATFAVPGDYIDYGNSNGGTPILARRYCFHAFITSNTLAFACSMLATIYLMRSGNPLFSLWSRKANLGLAFYFISISITCLVAAFALAAYVVLALVAHETAIVIFISTWAILLYNETEFIATRYLLLKPLHTRKGLIWACGVSGHAIMYAMVSRYWPFIFIFGGAFSAKQSSEKAPAPASAPLAST